jgi:hypothetical protein
MSSAERGKSYSTEFSDFEKELALAAGTGPEMAQAVAIGRIAKEAILMRQALQEIKIHFITKRP